MITFELIKLVLMGKLVLLTRTCVIAMTRGELEGQTLKKYPALKESENR